MAPQIILFLFLRNLQVQYQDNAKSDIFCNANKFLNVHHKMCFIGHFTHHVHCMDCFIYFQQFGLFGCDCSLIFWVYQQTWINESFRQQFQWAKFDKTNQPSGFKIMSKSVCQIQTEFQNLIRSNLDPNYLFKNEFHTNFKRTELKFVRDYNPPVV